MQEHIELTQTDSTQTDIPVLEPMTLLDILDRMFRLYWSHFQLFLAIVTVYFLSEFVVDQIVFVFAQGTLSVVNITILGWMNLCSFVVSFLVFAGVAYTSTSVYLEKAITPGTALGGAWHRFWSYLGSSLLYFLVVGCLFITLIGIPFGIFFLVRWSLYMFPVLFEGTPAWRSLRRSSELVKGCWW